MEHEATFDLPDGLELTPVEQDVLSRLPVALSDGLQIFRWWLKTDAERTYADKYALMREPESSNTNFGFYDRVPLERGILPVAGVVQEMFYDRAKGLPGSERQAAEWMRDQVREFVTRYFMRTSSRRQQEIFVKRDERRPLPGWLQSLSLCPQPDPQMMGFGYSQYFYKQKGRRDLRRFPTQDRQRMFDLREIGTRYDWVLGSVQIFDFGLSAQTGRVGVFLPVAENAYVVWHPELVVCRDNPSPEVLGEYGYGYTFIANPAPDGIWAYGPEKLTSAFEYIHFRVLKSGEVRVKMAFCANQPRRILVEETELARQTLRWADRWTAGAASLLGEPWIKAYERTPLRYFQPDPAFAAIDLANLATLGLAGSQLEITRQRLVTNIMGAHFLMLYDFILNSLTTFKRVSNWLDEKNLPLWVTHPDMPI